jgi:hypothetical protein
MEICILKHLKRSTVLRDLCILRGKAMLRRIMLSSYFNYRRRMEMKKRSCPASTGSDPKFKISIVVRLEYYSSSLFLHNSYDSIMIRSWQETDCCLKLK